MARPREPIPQKTKEALIREAGMKCANPGCVNYRTHMHHIRQWAVYETNDQEHMIAICPACHDAVHHGTLKIDDETLYRWKGIPRTATKQDLLYVEPGHSPKLLLGSVAATGDTGLTVFQLSPTNRLSFRLANGDIFLVNLSISTVPGQEVIRIVDNHVRHAAEEPVRYHRRPGQIRVSAPDTPDFLPAWALACLRAVEPDYALSGELILVDIEVLEPGLVRVQGIWAESTRAVVITKELIAFMRPGMQQPISLCGQGASTVLDYHGPITSALFHFED